MVRSCASDIFKHSWCGVNHVPDTELLLSSKISNGNVNNGGINDISSSYCPLDHQMEATVKLHTAYGKGFENVGYHACETRKIWVMRRMSMWIVETISFQASKRCMMSQSSQNTWCVTSFVRGAKFYLATQETLLSFWLQVHVSIHKEEFLVVSRIQHPTRGKSQNICLQKDCNIN